MNKTPFHKSGHITPKCFKSHSVSYFLKEVIEENLKWLQKLGVIEKVNHSDWATPIISVPKDDQSVC